MKWSWKLGRLAGIDTYVHASFLLIVAWAAVAAYSGAGTGLAVVLGVAFLLAVFGSVLLHELGHALVARRYGIRTRRIVLLPIGGVAQLEGDPATPKHELAIALAGPAVNFALAAGLFVITQAFGIPSYGLLGSLMIANLSLGLFNLIPAFPMDGGRALRALLATRVGGEQATHTAVYVGKVAAIALGLIGLFTNWVLTLVALFVYFAASVEARRAGAIYRSWSGNRRPGTDRAHASGWPFGFRHGRQAREGRRSRPEIIDVPIPGFDEPSPRPWDQPRFARDRGPGGRRLFVYIVRG